jgi:hypothetical protein
LARLQVSANLETAFRGGLDLAEMGINVYMTASPGTALPSAFGKGFSLLSYFTGPPDPVVNTSVWCGEHSCGANVQIMVPE